MERGHEGLAIGARVEVRGDGLGAGGREFAVEVGHDFLWCDGMWGGAHRRMPFCGITCEALGGAGCSVDCAASFGEVSADGSSKLRRAGRARKRRERTVLIGRWRRSAISA